MFVTVVLNVEYMDIASRKMWYLKNLLHCKDNGWIMITHEYICKHFEELQDSITDRFIDQFEMRRFTLEEVKDVEQYFVPDKIFEELENKKGSRTEMLCDLYSQPNPEFDVCLQRIFAQIKQRHPDEKIEGIFHCLEGFESLRKIAEENHCPLINYSFSAFRKVHGYRQTLYYSNYHSHFWDGDECAARYQRLLHEDYSSLPIFSNKELIALIGKEHTLPLMQLMNSRPMYEMGVCCECFSLIPPVFMQKKYTDDDIIYECKKHYSSDKLKVRSHAAHMKDIQVDRSEVHNDPVSTILSCRRLTAVHSQILLKVLLWGRTAVTKTNGLPFTFLCANNYSSEREIDLFGLNFYILGYLIPGDLMFSDGYWKWRLSNPSEVDICQMHINHLFNALNIDLDKVMRLHGKERFRYLLESRHCDEQLINGLLNEEHIDNVNWDVASSQFDIVFDNCVKSFWRIDTENEDGSLRSVLSVSVQGAKEVRFYPLYDVAGFARLDNVKLNGKVLKPDCDTNRFLFMPKYNGCFTFPLENTITDRLDVECTWEYKKVFDYLK